MNINYQSYTGETTSATEQITFDYCNFTDNLADGVGALMRLNVNLI